MISTVWTNGNIAQVAMALVMLAPSPEFAGGVLALCVALGAVTPEMKRAVEEMPQEVRVIEVQS